MIISIKHEMLVFWSSFACAQVILILFDFFRTLRKITPHSKLAVGLEDIIFSVSAFRIFYLCIYITNNAHMRWYIPVALLLSGIIYLCTETATIQKLWGYFIKLILFITAPFARLTGCILSFFARRFFKLKSAILSFFGKTHDKFVQIATKKPHKPHKNKDLI